MRKIKLITDKDAEFIKAHYKGTPAAKMCELLEKETGTIVGKTTMLVFYKQNGLKSGLDGRFKKGHRPQNAFKKGFEGLTEEQIERIKAHQYKKGDKPWDTKEIGTRSLRTKDDKRQYAWIKLSDNNWVMEHNLVWEKAYGKLPEDKILIHIDGNNYNNSLDNLMPVTRQELLNVNQEGLTDDAELNKVIIYRAKINRKLGRKGWIAVITHT